jgi:nucleotide-binding universal stress UspA family protein
LAVDLRELVENTDDVNRREAELAGRIAEEGAALAREAGLDAEARAVEIDGRIDDAVLAHADQLDAAAIVLGSRSRSSVRSLLLGSTANEIAQLATRPVFLVPSTGLAAGRRTELDSERVVR